MKDNQKIVNQYEYPSFFASAFALRGSVTPKVFKYVILATLYACIVSFISKQTSWISFSITPFEYAGLVMGLILVFRVNAGYDRWWEARKLWGSVVNSSRNLAILVTNYIDPSAKEQKATLINYIAAMPFLMKYHLRQSDSLEEVQDLLDKKTLQALKKAVHKPNFISSKIAAILSDLLQENKLNQFSYLKAEEYRSIIIDCQGACERILKTPMPFVMAIKSRRLILLFVLILPIAMVDYSYYVSPFVTALVSYAFFALDQIGVELQNPFSQKNLSHLPLTEICNGIKQNVLEIEARS